MFFHFYLAAPKDKHLVFKVMPIIHESAVPPQVMFSALGIVSPPPISVVLKHLRFLLEDESSLDHWTYKHGSIETVFSELFSFLQGKWFYCIIYYVFYPNSSIPIILMLLVSAI